MNLTALRKALAAIILGMALPATGALAAGIQTLNIPGQGSLPPLTGALVSLREGAVADPIRAVRSDRHQRLPNRRQK